MGFTVVSMPKYPHTGRIIGIDYGTKRVGIAVTDPLQLITSPLITVRPDETIPFLMEYDQKEGIVAFVVGLTKYLDNRSSPMTGVVAQFIVCLKKAFCHKYIVHYDEKFTSKMARQSMIIGAASKKTRI